MIVYRSAYRKFCVQGFIVYIVVTCNKIAQSFVKMIGTQLSIKF